MIVDATPGRPWTHASATRGTVVSTSLAICLHEVEEIERAIVEVARDARAAPRLVLPLVRALVLAAERAAAQGAPRGDAEAELLRHRHELPLDGALEERVLDLQRDERRPPAKLGHRLRLRRSSRRGYR